MKAKNAARFHGRRGGGWLSDTDPVPGTLAADLERIKAEHAASQPAELEPPLSLFDEDPTP